MTEAELRTWSTETARTDGFERLRTVVCVTARENYELEQVENRGIGGWEKYAIVGVSFVNA